jgi:hypothetical protein
MKKTIKSKLRLNSQTLRTLRASGLQDVQGGRAIPIQSLEICRTDDCVATVNCTVGCRGCG